MNYLLIENRCKTNPSVDYLVSLGATTSRGDENKIGMFGSGTIYSIALLARYDILSRTKICLGTTVFTFEVYSKELKDSEGWTRWEKFVRMKQQNGPTYNLNLSVDFGGVEWDNPEFAVREFVSNACDGSVSYAGNLSTVRIDTTIPDSPRMLRAKDGFIRVYIPITEEISDYVNNITQHFICLQPDYISTRKIIPNRSRGPARFYRRGVHIGTMGTSSLFHYNIPDIDLKESRVIDSYAAKEAAAQAIATCNDEEIYAKFLRGVINPATKDDSLWEATLPTYELNPTYNYDIPYNKREECLKTFKSALDTVFADSVLCGSGVTARMIENKGYSPVQVDSEYIDLLRTGGIKADVDILNKNEIEGRQILDANDNVKNTLDMIWDRLYTLGMTMGRDKPKVNLFTQNTGDGMLGYYRDEQVFIRQDIAEDKGLILYQTILEELAHHITKSLDCSRDLQEFAFKVAACLMADRRSAESGKC